MHTHLVHLFLFRVQWIAVKFLPTIHAKVTSHGYYETEVQTIWKTKFWTELRQKKCLFVVVGCLAVRIVCFENFGLVYDPVTCCTHMWSCATLQMGWSVIMIAANLWTETAENLNSTEWIRNKSMAFIIVMMRDDDSSLSVRYLLKPNECTFS